VVEIGGGTLRVTELSGGRDRVSMVEHLAALAANRRPTLVGLDFPFSYAARFLDYLGIPDFFTLCARMRVEATRVERFVDETVGPWWARWQTDPVRTRRVVERQDAALAAESPLRALGRKGGRYDFTGARQVGKAAITGIAAIGHLMDRAPQVRVWPFHELVEASCVVAEIWPRLALGGIVKQDPAVRRRCVDALRRSGVRLGPAHAREAVRSADAFDALHAAVAMGRGSWPPVAPARLPPEATREGWILGVPWNASRERP